MNRDSITILSFDVVGTLIDFETGILEWFQPWLREHKRKIDDDEVLRRFARAEEQLQQTEPKTSFTAMLPRIHGELSRQWELDADEGDALDFRDSVRDWPAFSDAHAALKTLGERYRLVAVTNADAWALEHMSRTLGNPFHDQVTQDEVGVNKPDSAVWRYLLKKLGVGPEAVLHCAQSVFHDIVSAHAFGLPTAWIERRHNVEGSGATPSVELSIRPDIHVHNLSELVEQLRKPAA
ncbi:MAG: HAD-IA family hydrolase [Halofilum sp. (in: g-proteobacteria)]|nr:HAD-IA family hydrolase [Halofilum sp. (in: g-proteobacteria)]